MTQQIILLFVASVLFAIGLVSLLGWRRILEGAAIVVFALPLALAVFIVAVGVLLYRRLGGG
jgi:hypothetical protein